MHKSTEKSSSSRNVSDSAAGIGTANLSRASALGVLALSGVSMMAGRRRAHRQEDQLIRAGAFQADGLGSQNGFITGTGLACGVDVKGVVAGVVGTGSANNSVGVQGVSATGIGVEAVTTSGIGLSVESQATTHPAISVANSGVSVPGATGGIL